MEIREFAERILFGDSLDDKLIRPRSFEDEAPGRPVETPRYPHRPVGLSLDLRDTSEKVDFPSVYQLDREPERGRALHFFGNHELLALELMALCLLKFPEAPAKFRRGVAQTMLEEQMHTRLYVRRMERLGVEFGTFPVNDFFWKCTAGMECPMEFVSRMSLTFEQANLDYARYYEGVFREIGDHATAKILARVHRDEIDHVKHGLAWFNRWRDQAESEWEAYRRVLRFPLTPNRAKGIGFQKEARRLAGLSADFIANLEVYSRSKGRSPDVFCFNPACESQVALNKPGFTPSEPVRVLAADLSVLMMFVAGADDIVLAPRMPSQLFLAGLQSAGFALPEFVEWAPGVVAAVHAEHRTIRHLCPWGWSPDTVSMFKVARHSVTDAANESATEWRVALAAVPIWDDAFRQVYSKALSAELLADFLHEYPDGKDWLCEPEVVGRACTTLCAVRKRLTELRGMGFQRLAVKADFSSSGRQIVRIAGEEMSPTQQQRVDSVLAKQGTVVVEPWLDKRCDLSWQMEVGPNGKASILGGTRFLTDARGQYRGSVIGRYLDAVDTGVVKCLFGGGRKSRRLHRMLDALTARVAKRLAAAGYSGPAGIDAFIYRGSTGLRLKPLVEINPRYTMGCIALALNKHLCTGRVGLWLTLTAKDIRATGFNGFAEFAADLERCFPLQLASDADKRISEGVLLTNDPARAEAFLSVLIVGRSLEQCEGVVVNMRS